MDNNLNSGWTEPEDNIDFLRQEAYNGDPNAQAALGVAYLTGGQGVEQDCVQAVLWLTLASENGFVVADTMLGYCYENGKGVEKNLYRAAEYYQEAARLNDPMAMYSMGRFYEKGTVVGKNMAIALRLYGLAAFAGLFDAMITMGRLYEEGTGVELNLDKALDWYTKAFDRGCFQAEEHIDRVKAKIKSQKNNENGNQGDYSE